jgi:hypothetical protein
MPCTTNPHSSTSERPPPLPRCPTAPSTTCITTAHPSPARDRHPVLMFDIPASPFRAPFLRLNKPRNTTSTHRSLLFRSPVTPTNRSREYTIPTMPLPCRRARSLRRCSSTSTHPSRKTTPLKLHPPSLTCINRSSHDPYRRARFPLLHSNSSATTSRKYKCRRPSHSSRNSAARHFLSQGLYRQAGRTAYSRLSTTTGPC